MSNAFWDIHNHVLETPHIFDFIFDSVNSMGRGHRLFARLYATHIRTHMYIACCAGNADLPVGLFPSEFPIINRVTNIDLV